jgi:hypothetical protein
MLALAIPQASFEIYTPDPEQNMPKNIRMLCAFAEFDLAAVVIDQPVRDYR